MYCSGWLLAISPIITNNSASNGFNLLSVIALIFYSFLLFSDMPTAKISFFGRFCCTYRIANAPRCKRPGLSCNGRTVGKTGFRGRLLTFGRLSSISRQSIPYPGKRNVRRGGILWTGRTVRVALLSFFARFVYIVKQCVQIFLCAFYANSYPIAAR